MMDAEMKQEKKLTTEFNNDFSKEIYEQTYKFGNEDINKTFYRVAKELASVEIDKEKWTSNFLELLTDFKFVPGGRITSNAGVPLRGTSMINCYVDGFMGEDQDSMESILDTLRRQALILKSEGGYGFCADVMRPRGAFIRGIGNESPGSVKMLDMWDTQSSVITAGSGNKNTHKNGKGKIRKGAQMVTMSCWHPDIEEFITAKQTPGKLTKFNMSVLITDDLMDAVKNNLPWNLEYPDYENNSDAYKKEWNGNIKEWKSKGYGVSIYKTFDNANELWDLIMESTYNRNEPGVLFIDTVNKLNNLKYCEYISASNPCVVGNTLVLTNIGWIKISNLQDHKDVKIITRDKNGILCESELKWSGVTQKNDDIIKVEFSNGEYILCNKKHKLYLSDYSEIEMSEVMSRDDKIQIIGHDDNLLDITKITELNYKEDVYDLTAVPNYNFFTLLNKEEKIITEPIIINDTMKLNYYSIVNTNRGKIFAHLLNTDDVII